MVEEQKLILFVEDDYTSISGVYEEIEKQHPHWIPQLACTVHEAWDVFRHEPVHAAIIDIMLPDVKGVKSREEGVALAQWIRNGKAITDAAPDCQGDIYIGNSVAPICLHSAREKNDVKNIISNHKLVSYDLGQEQNDPEINHLGVCIAEKVRTSEKALLSWLRLVVANRGDDSK